MIDVIEQPGGGILKPDAWGVTGCSRYGKGAFAGLLETGTTDGTFRISSLKAGNLADWRDWQTPTLADGSPPPSSPPSSPPPSSPPTTGCRVTYTLENVWNADVPGEGAGRPRTFGVSSLVDISVRHSGAADDMCRLDIALPGTGP